MRRLLAQRDARLFLAGQTLSITVGAALITVVDYRLLLIAQALVVGGAGVYLLTRRELAARVSPDVDG